MMGSFVERLKGQEKKENPLESLGLGPGILSLGLSEDELYEICKRLATNLLARVHPDRTKKNIPEAIRFSQVVDILKNRKNFEQALKDFRETRSFLLRSQRVDSEIISKQAKTIKDLETVVADKTIALEDALKFKKWMVNFLNSQSVRFRSSEIKRLGDLISLAVVGFTFSPRLALEPSSYGEFKGLYDREREFIHSRLRRGKEILRRSLLIGKLRVLFEHTELASITITELIERAKKSRLKNPVIRWSLGIAAKEAGYSVIAGERYKIFSESDVPGKFSVRYWKVLEWIQERFGDKEVAEIIISPQILRVINCYLEKDLISEGVYPIGTLDLNAIKEGSILHSLRRRLSLSWDILPKISPFFSQERALVAIALPTAFYLKSPNVLSQWQALSSKVSKTILKNPLFFSHIIMGVNEE